MRQAAAAPTSPALSRRSCLDSLGIIIIRLIVRICPIRLDLRPEAWHCHPREACSSPPSYSDACRACRRHYRRPGERQGRRGHAARRRSLHGGLRPEFVSRHPCQTTVTVISLVVRHS